MIKKLITIKLQIIILSLLLFLNISCLSNNTIDNNLSLSNQVPLTINLMTANDTNDNFQFATGSIEVIIYQGTVYDLKRNIFNITRTKFEDRKINVKVFSGDTYSIFLNARIKFDKSPDIEHIFNANIESLYVPKENFSSPIIVSANLKQVESIKLYPAKLVFEPLYKNTFSYNEPIDKIIVKIYDQFDNLIDFSNYFIKLNIDYLDNTKIKPELKGELITNSSNGIATFNNISITNANILGITQFIASIINLDTTSNEINAKSEKILVYPKSNKSVIFKLQFIQPPISVVATNQKWEEFKIAILDQYDQIVDTNEIITLVDPTNTITGTLSIKANNGIATFNNIYANKLGTISINAYLENNKNISIKSNPIKVVNYVSKINVFVTSNYHIYKYICYIGNAEKPIVDIKLNWLNETSFIKKVKPSFDKEKFFILDDNNYFFVFNNLDNIPSISLYNLSAFNSEQIVDFTPSLDNLSIYLTSNSSIYKWHIVNEPNFIISNAKNIKISNSLYVTEIANNNLYALSYVMGNSIIYTYDFSTFPPVFKTELPIFSKKLSQISISPDKKHAAFTEINGSTVYLIDTNNEQIEHITLGTPAFISSNAFLTFTSNQKLYLIKSSDSNIYSYSLTSNDTSIIATLFNNSFNLKALDADKTKRYLFFLDSGLITKIKIFDSFTDTFISNDIELKDENDNNISNINEILVF